MSRPSGLADRIVSREITSCELVSRDPAFRFATGGGPVSRGFLVRLQTAGGLQGVGYAAVRPHLGVSAEALRSALEALAERCLERAIADLNAIAREAEEQEVISHAATAVDLALWDLFGKALGVPVHDCWGGAVCPRFPVMRIVGLKAPEAMAQIARDFIAAGYRHLKIKLDGETGLDVARVARIREAVGAEIHLAVDANQTYTAAAALAVLPRLEALGVEAIEQPVPKADLDGLTALARAAHCTIEADEAAETFRDLVTVVTRRAATRVPIKLDKLGSIRRAISAVELCRSEGMDYRIGAVVGSRLLAAGALHLAACVAPDGAVELGEFDRFTGDPITGLEVRAGHLAVPTGPGLGVAVRARLA